MCTRPTQLINVAECVGGASENISPSIECGGKQLNILMVGSDCYKVKFRAATIQHHQQQQKQCSFHFFSFSCLSAAASPSLSSSSCITEYYLLFFSSFPLSFVFFHPFPLPSLSGCLRPPFFFLSLASLFPFSFCYSLIFSFTLAFHPLFFRLFPSSLPSEHLLLRLFPVLFFYSISVQCFVYFSSTFYFRPLLSSLSFLFFYSLSFYSLFHVLPSVFYSLLFPFLYIISSPFFPFPPVPFIHSNRSSVCPPLSFLLSSLLFPFSHALPSVLYFFLFPFLFIIPSPFPFLSDPSFYSSVPFSSSRSCLSFPHSLSKLILVLTSNSFGLPTFPSFVHHVLKYFL